MTSSLQQPENQIQSCWYSGGNALVVYQTCKPKDHRFEFWPMNYNVCHFLDCAEVDVVCCISFDFVDI